MCHLQLNFTSVHVNILLAICVRNIVECETVHLSFAPVLPGKQKRQAEQQKKKKRNEIRTRATIECIQHSYLRAAGSWCCQYLLRNVQNMSLCFTYNIHPTILHSRTAHQPPEKRFMGQRNIQLCCFFFFYFLSIFSFSSSVSWQRMRMCQVILFIRS